MPLIPPNGGDGTPFNPHSPGPIGDVTPDTVAATTLTASGPTATIGGAGVSGTRFQVIASGGYPSILLESGSVFCGMTIDGTAFYIQSSVPIISLQASAVGIGGTGTLLVAPAANVLAQRNGTNGQEFQVYETDDGMGNYGRAVMRATAGGPYVVGAEAAGGGTLRSLNLVGNQVKANNLLVSQIIVQGSAGISTTVAAGASSTINITASGAIAGDVAIIDCAALLSGVGWTGTGGLFFLATVVSPNTLSIVVFNTDLINAYSISGNVNYLIEGVR